jgi:hypothetical protein
MVIREELYLWDIARARARRISYLLIVHKSSQGSWRFRKKMFSYLDSFRVFCTDFSQTKIVL